MKTKIRRSPFGTLRVASLLALGLCLGFNLYGQDSPYKTAVGIRAGGTTGATVKHFYNATTAFEGIVGSFGNGISITGLIEKFQPVYNAEGLSVYYGGGMHLAFYNGQGSQHSHIGHEVDYHKDNDFGLAVNGIVGLEYRMPEKVPIAVSLDLKPFLEFGSGGYVVGGLDPSIGVKFIIR